MCSSCTNHVRCTCHNYGHLSRTCLTHRRPTKIFHRKSPDASVVAPSTHLGIDISSSLSLHSTPLHSSSPPPLSPATAVEHSDHLIPMANNPVDPHTLVLHGFMICHRSQEEDMPQCVYAFLSTSVRRINEDVAITVVAPEVDPLDFPLAANAIRNFIINNLRLLVIDICPSGLGAATITFASCRDRQVAMGALHHLDPYWLSFVPHDTGSNLCHLTLNCSCWLVLVNFPLDCANDHCIAIALNSFCNLIQWHESSNKARYIVLVKLHSSARIPHSVVVTVGDEPFARCCVFVVYLLTEAQLQQPIDIDPLPPHGRSPHPMPSPPLCWLGLGTSHPPHRDRGNEQEGSSSCVHGHIAHLVSDAHLSRQTMNPPANQVVSG
jgi:hypothetical protein